MRSINHNARALEVTRGSQAQARFQEGADFIKRNSDQHAVDGFGEAVSSELR